MLRSTLERVALASVFAFACTTDTPSTETPDREAAVDRVDVLGEPTLTADAFVIQGEDALRGVEVYEDRLVFVYDGEPAAYPEVGNVVTGIEGGGFIRRIMTARLEGNRLTCDTESAFLADFFEDLSFHATFSPPPDFVTDESGRRVDALTSGLSFPSIDVNEACSLAGGARVELKIDIDPVFELEIDLRNRHFRSEVGGDLDGDINATFGGLGISCDWEIPRERRPSREWTQTFFVPVGFIPVPVIITHELFLTAKLDVEAVASSVVEASAGGTIRFSAIVEHTRDQGWQTRTGDSPAGRSSLTARDPDNMHLQARFSPGFGYLGKVYDTAGPEFTISGWVQGEVDLTWCEWKAKVTGGITGQAGAKLEVPVWDRTVFDFAADLDILDPQTIYQNQGTLPIAACEDEPEPPVDPMIDPTSCRSTGCAAGDVCDSASGMCSADSCETTMCAADEACRAGSGCEASCADVMCADGQTCRAGECLDDLCADTECADGQVCNPADGTCRVDPCETTTCGLAETCDSDDGSCAPADACSGLTCPEGQVCSDGECGFDLCAGIACDEGEACDVETGMCMTDECGGCADGEMCNTETGECEMEEADPCASAGTDCNACNRMAGCGWCEGGGGCMSNDREAECGADNWRDSPSACPVCGVATSCGECTTTPGLAGFCVWCSGQCVNQSTTEFEMCGGDYVAVPGSCG